MNDKEIPNAKFDKNQTVKIVNGLDSGKHMKIMICFMELLLENGCIGVLLMAVKFLIMN